MSGFSGISPTPISSNNASEIRSKLSVPSTSEMNAAIAQSTADKANLQKGELATASTTLTFSLTDYSCLVYVSRMVSGLAAVYAVDIWGTKQLCGDANVANITISGSDITVTRGPALNGNAFVTVIG